MEDRKKANVMRIAAAGKARRAIHLMPSERAASST
jgi:hypothetical protein